ncbi:MAG: YwaF family protein [Erysipelotrichaceae bacterium]|nr:YwaF family protein [Erysipelotrichaceae bacterium]
MTKFKIQPYNGIYKIYGLSAILTGTIISFLLADLEPILAQKILFIIVTGLLIHFLIYKLYLPFDKEYKRIMGKEFNIYSEFILYPCNVIIIVLFIALLIDSKLLLSFCFHAAMTCPILAILFPPLGFNDDYIYRFRVFTFYFYHYMIIICAFLLVVTGKYIPNVRDVLPAMLVYAVFSFICYLLNVVLIKTGLNPKSNYFYNYFPDGNFVMEAIYKYIPHPFLFTLPPMFICYLFNVLVTLIINLFI